MEKEMHIILSMDEPTVVAVENVFEDDDGYEKMVGCRNCKGKRQCCGNCPFLMENGDCQVHIDEGGIRKPYKCIRYPDIRRTMSVCIQEFICTKGSKIGEVRKVREPNV